MGYFFNPLFLDSNLKSFEPESLTKSTISMHLTVCFHPLPFVTSVPLLTYLLNYIIYYSSNPLLACGHPSALLLTPLKHSVHHLRTRLAASTAYPTKFSANYNKSRTLLPVCSLSHTHPHTHSLTHSIAHSLTKSLSHSLTHSLAHKRPNLL